MGIVSLGLVVCSLWPLRPLSDLAGLDRAVAYLEKKSDAATFVVVWPPERAEKALSTLPPSLQAADAVPVEPPNRRHYLQLLVIGPAGFDSPPELEDAEELERQRFDEVEVGSFVWAGGDRIDFDLRSHLAQTRVELRGPTHNVQCNVARPDGGWSCPGRPGWNHVRPAALQVENNDWSCVWAHPVTGHDLILDLGERDLWDRVEVEAALADPAAASPAGASVQILLEVEGVGSRRLIRTNRRGGGHRHSPHRSWHPCNGAAVRHHAQRWPAAPGHQPSNRRGTPTMTVWVRQMERVFAFPRRYPTVVAFVAFAAFGLSIDRDVAWTDDARFYVPAAASYGDWIARAITLDTSAYSRTAIDRAFGKNHEHPPVAKYVMAAGWLLFYHWTDWLSEVAACRVGITLLWAWMCALVFRLVRERRGLAAGAFAALALATMPRVLFHGQVETLDLPVAALLVATFDALWRVFERPRWRTVAWTIVLFGLALGCKLNAPFFLAAAVAYWLLVWPPRYRPEGLQLNPMPVVLLGMVMLSPLIAWLLWPWLWFDTIERLGAYLQFHLQHYGILFYYGGTLYGEKVAPWHAAWVMVALTVPLPILVLSLLGAWTPLRGLASQIRAIIRPGTGPELAHQDAAMRLGVLALLQAGVQLAALSLPGVPVYGGVKLFLPLFPFVAILAGLGFAEILLEIQRSRLSGRTQSTLAISAAFLLIMPGFLGLVAYHGTWLSYYNELARGIRGATASGFERQYYDLAYQELPRTLNALLPQGGSVAVLPNPKEYSPYVSRWQRNGTLDRNIRRAPVESADLLILTHERRWQQYPDLRARFRKHRIIAQRTMAGIPLYSIYDLRQ
ncbi:ArnT family glycosyltransferase [Myxococcota bacterium]